MRCGSAGAFFTRRRCGERADAYGVHVPPPLRVLSSGERSRGRASLCDGDAGLVAGEDCAAGAEPDGVGQRDGRPADGAGA